MTTSSRSRVPVTVACRAVLSGSGQRPSMSRYSCRRRARRASHCSRLVAPSRKRSPRRAVCWTRYLLNIASPALPDVGSPAGTGERTRRANGRTSTVGRGKRLRQNISASSLDGRGVNDVRLGQGGEKLFDGCGGDRRAEQVQPAELGQTFQVGKLGIGDVRALQ